MKKTIIFCMAAVLLFGCSVKTEEKENYSDEIEDSTYSGSVRR